MHSIQLCLVIALSITLHTSLAWRNYNLLLRDIKCNINPNYVSHVSCFIDNSSSVSSISADVQMTKEVRLLRLDFFVDLERPNRESISLFRGTDLNGCDIITENVTQPLIKMYKELTMKAGYWPKKCPIAADFRYLFRNITLDSNYLPTFVPRTNFKRNYNLILTDIKCDVNENYVRNVNCSIDKSPPGLPRVSVYTQMLKEIKDLRVGVFINLNREDSESIPFLKVSNLDGCRIMNKNIKSPVLIMLRDLISKYSNWSSECPIRAGFAYSFRDMTLDINYLPQFVPEADFKVGITISDRKIQFWQTNVKGRVSHLKRNKMRKY